MTGCNISIHALKHFKVLQIVQFYAYPFSAESWGWLSQWLLLCCRQTGPGAQSDYLTFQTKKKDLHYGARQCFFWSPLHAWHLPSTNEIILLAETQIHAARQSLMWAVQHMPSTLLVSRQPQTEAALTLMWRMECKIWTFKFSENVFKGLKKTFCCSRWLWGNSYTEKEKDVSLIRFF